MESYPFLRSIFFLLLCVSQARAAVVYVNTFDDASGLNGFTASGSGTASVTSQQLVISIPSPLREVVVLDSAVNFDPFYHSILNQNEGVVSWAFNVSNQDGAFNNGFKVILASDQADPFSLPAHGYYFAGGGMVGNRMGLWRFDNGADGQTQVLVDVINGLGPLPQMGSIRVA